MMLLPSLVFYPHESRHSQLSWTSSSSSIPLIPSISNYIHISQLYSHYILVEFPFFTAIPMKFPWKPHRKISKTPAPGSSWASPPFYRSRCFWLGMVCGFNTLRPFRPCGQEKNTTTSPARPGGRGPTAKTYRKRERQGCSGFWGVKILGIEFTLFTCFMLFHVAEMSAALR